MRNVTRAVWACALGMLLVVGCKREAHKHPSKSANKAAAPAAQSCAEQAAALRRWIGETQRTVYHDPAPAVRHLPAAAGTTRLARGKCVSLSLAHGDPDDRLLFEGQAVPLGDLAADEQLAIKLHNIKMMRQRLCLFLSIDRQARWKNVAGVTQQMTAVVQRMNDSRRKNARWLKKHPKLAKAVKKAADEVIKHVAPEQAGKTEPPEPAEKDDSAVDIALVFAPRVPIQAPPASAMTRKLHKMGVLSAGPHPRVDAAKYTDKVYDLWRDPLFGGCKLHEGLPGGDISLASSQGDQELAAKLLSDHLVRRLKACRCKLDIPSLKTLLYWGHSSHQAFDAAWFRSDPAGAPVKLPPDTPWSSAYKTVLAALKTHKALTLQ